MSTHPSVQIPRFSPGPPSEPRSIRSKASERMGSDGVLSVHMGNTSISGRGRSKDVLKSYEATGLQNVSKEQFASYLMTASNAALTDFEEANAIDAKSIDREGRILSNIEGDSDAGSGPIRPLEMNFINYSARLSEKALSFSDVAPTSPRSGGSVGSFFSTTSLDDVHNPNIDADGLRKLQRDTNYSLNDFKYRGHILRFVCAYMPTIMGVISIRREPLSEHGREALIRKLWEKSFGQLEWSRWGRFCMKLTLELIASRLNEIYRIAKSCVNKELSAVRRHWGSEFTIKYVNEMINDRSRKKLIYKNFYEEYEDNMKRVLAGIVTGASIPPDPSGVFRNKSIVSTFRQVKREVVSYVTDESKVLFDECLHEFPEYDTAYSGTHLKHEQVGLLCIVAGAVEVAYNRHAKSLDRAVTTEELTRVLNSLSMTDAGTLKKINEYIYNIDFMSSDQWMILDWETNYEQEVIDRLRNSNKPEDRELVAKLDSSVDEHLDRRMTARLDAERALLRRDDEQAEGEVQVGQMEQVQAEPNDV